jgi:hypothetical protein
MQPDPGLPGRYRTERENQVIDFWIAFYGVIITVGRLVRQAWTLYRWENRPRRRP